MDYMELNGVRGWEVMIIRNRRIFGKLFREHHVAEKDLMFSLFFSNITGLLDVRFEIKSMGATAFEGVSKCTLRSSHGMFVIE